MLHLSFIISLLCLLYTTLCATYNTTKLSPWETIQINLRDSDTNYFIILEFQNTPRKQKGDIVTYISSTSTIETCVYTDYTAITQQGRNFTDCKWKFNPDESDYVIKNTDINYVHNGTYYYAIRCVDSVFDSDVTIFNELDMKHLQPNTRFNLKGIYSNKLITLTYSNDDAKEHLIFSFYMKDTLSEYTANRAGIVIYDEEGELISTYEDFESKFYDEKINTGKRSEVYYIELYYDASTYKNEITFNVDIEVDTYAEEPNKFKLNDTLKKTYVQNTDYYFYTDISMFDIGEEGVVEFSSLKMDYFKDGNLTIHTMVLSCNEDEIPNFFPITTTTFECLSRERLRVSEFILLPYKKQHIDDKYFIFKITITNINSPFYMETAYVQRMSSFHFTPNDFIVNNSISTLPLTFSSKMPAYAKITYDPVLLVDSSLVFFVDQKFVSTFFEGALINDTTGVTNSKSMWNNIYVLHKGEGYVHVNNTIVICLANEMNQIAIQVERVYHDVMFVYEQRPINQPFMLELTNCKRKLLFIESIEQSQVSSSQSDTTNNYIAIERLYGDGELYMDDKVDIPLLSKQGALIISKSQMINNNNFLLELRCTYPTSYIITYVERIEDVTTGTATAIQFVNGESKYYQLKAGVDKEFAFMNDDPSFEYFITFETFNTKRTFIVKDNSNNEYTLPSEDGEMYKMFREAGSEGQHKKTLTIKNSNTTKEDIIMRVSFSTNYLYERIVEGHSDIPYENRLCLFKLKKNNDYDYVNVKLFTRKNVTTVNMTYSFSKFIDNETITLPYRYLSFDKQTEFTYSNPYNKLVNVLDKEFFYFTMNFLNENKYDYNIYTEITYIKHSSEDVYINAPHEIHIGKDYRVADDFIANVNSNNNDKYYLIYTFNSNCKDCQYVMNVFYIGTGSQRKEDELVYNETIQQNRSVIKYIPQYNRTVFNINYLNNNNNNSSDVQGVYTNNNTKSNDCIYMSYFVMSEKTYQNIKLNNDYNLTYDDNHFDVTLKWTSFFSNEEYQNVTYYIYELPYSPENEEHINNMCYLLNYEANHTQKNSPTIKLNLNSGTYLVNVIMESNNEYNTKVIYNAITMNVNIRLHHFIYGGTITIGVIVILVVIVLLYIRYRKRNKTNELLEEAKQQEVLFDKETFEDEASDNSFLLK